MSLLRKRCEYCREKIEKGTEVRRDVKIPGFTGMRPKNFCHEDHASKYEKKSQNMSKHSGKGCCH